jgi:hypothetical protein
MDLHPYDTVCHDTKRHDTIKFFLTILEIILKDYRDPTSPLDHLRL